jgi:sugar/nucleoside kinase (ribokinase family)
MLVIGELNVDLIATGLEQAPVLGRELMAEDFRVVLGSASAIFACGAARLGHPVTFVGKVGEDDFGRLCLAELAARDVDTSAVLVDPRVRTGVTVCLSTRGDRAMVTYPGAIAAFRASEVRDHVFRNKAHLHLTCFELQAALRPGFARLLQTARRRGLTTSFDPNADLRGPLGEAARELLPHVDVLFLNETEARDLARARTPERALDRLSHDERVVVVKLGEKGAVAARGSERCRTKGLSVRVVDTTGAGDSFAAGFVSAFTQGRSLAECLATGNACGALSTRAAGGTAAQPDRKVLSRTLRSQARRVRTEAR